MSARLNIIFVTGLPSKKSSNKARILVLVRNPRNGSVAALRIK
jgi:hypothetical protein